MRRVAIVSLLVAAVAVWFSVWVLMFHQTDAEKRDQCLYVAVSTYPSWDSDAPVLDTLDQCKNLPQAVKDDLRKKMLDFVNTAITKN